MGYMHDGVQARAYCGAVGTGKTEALVREVAGLVGSGADAGDVLVFAAGAGAAEALRGRIAAACPEATDVRVTTPLSWAVEVLGGEAAEAFTGRDGRVLNHYEQDFLFEDMRVTGIKQHRLREMLKFFYRGWSEMREDEPGWLISPEERSVHALAKANLSMVRAFHPCEAVAACVRYLAASPEALAGLAAPHVLADDFRAMSRASQRLTALLAGQTLTVAWDTVSALVGEEPYGYADGLDELAAQCDLERRGLSTFEGAPGAYEALRNLFRQDCIDAELPEMGQATEGGTATADGAGNTAAGSAIEVRTVGMLGDEPGSVVDVVREALEAGVAPEQVFVAAGRESWVGRMQAALEDAGIPASRVNGSARLKGDVRDPDKCADMAMANAVHLAAEPGSCLAWRCWCGFGDYLARSAAFGALSHALATAGGEEGARPVLTDLLFAMASEDAPASESDMLDRERLVERVRAGRAMLAETEGLAGAELVAAIRRHVCVQGQATPSFDALIGQVDEGVTATELLAHIDRALAPAAPHEGCVRVGGIDGLIGQTPHVLVLCGLVNGLYPVKGYFDLLERTIDDQAKMHERLIAQLVEACGKAGGRLVLSGFARADILDAEPMKLMSERVRLRNGRRVCEFGPSAVVDYVTGVKTAYVR